MKHVLSLFGAAMLIGAAPDEDRFLAERLKMVATQIEGRGIEDQRVLDAMRRVPRHVFVPLQHRDEAYEDRPLPIGHGQTISQPYIVAAMTELLDPKPSDRVLEVGTGSGYQAAILSRLVKEVYTVEIVPELGEQARRVLKAHGFDDVHVVIGDGYRGLPKRAPFDGIIVTAAPEKVPRPLLEQLRVGGRLIIPVGGRDQELKVYTKTETGYDVRSVFGVRFVPMTGEATQE